MKRLVVGVIAMRLAVAVAGAQGLGQGDLQIHGFATQSFVKTNGNNYLGLNSDAGSTEWTEAAVNINDQVSDKLRVGVQFHLTRLGAFGGDTPTVDWAMGDYSFKQWLGVRAGKVKIRWGLFNDTQDADPGYQWSLLPESVYGVDVRATNLSQYGVEAYGRVPLGEKLGTIDYSAYYGDYFYATNDGYVANFAQQGLVFTNQPGGKTPGFDLRWSTPIKGLQVAGSLMMYDATGNLTNGSYYQPLAFWPTYYAQYTHKKYYAAWQYVKLVQYQTVTVAGTAPSTSVQDSRAWFAMGSYRATDKLRVGAYYTHYLMASAGDSHNSANYFDDSVISGRYDLDSHFYAKLEGHIIKGNALGIYALDNLGALLPRTNVVVGKIGFTF